MITVRRTVYILWDRADQEVAVGANCYASTEKDIFLQSVYAGDEAYIRRSEDNGQTWERIEDWVGSIPLDNGNTLSRSLPAMYLDPQSGRLVRAYLENDSRPTADGSVSWFPASATHKVYFQCSQDEGRTWSDPEQLVITGDEFDETHWAPEIWYGKNGGVVMSDSAFTRPDGTIVMPFTMLRVPDEGEQRYKGHYRYLIAHDEEHGAWERQDACILGRWREDGSGIDWQISNYVRVPQTNSTDGACEPGACMLPDGRMFMIIRTRNFPDSEVVMPGAKHYAVSEDGGATWTDGQILRYDDRGAVYAPASFSRVFVSSKSSRLYLITNINDVPCYGCDPRTKLQIAEIDMDTLRVMRDSVTIIDERQEGQQESIRFSNFAWYEDRHTKNMILFMTPSPGPTGTWAAGDVKDTARSIDCAVPPHAYRYEIELPD